MKRFTKLFNTKATSVDDNAKTIRFKISDNQPDRMGEIVDQETWDFKNYLSNPVLLWGHNPDEPENVLGSTLALDVENGETYATVRLDEDINPKAGLVWKQLLRGTLRTVSVGFINKKFEYDAEDEDAAPVLKDNELLEISVVPIPANPRAVALSLKEGTISKKDATWLMEGMRKEADLLESQLKADANEKGENVDEIKQQIAALTDAVGKLTETNTAQAEKLDALTAQIEEAGKPPAETDEQKQAREAKEAEEAEAACKAEEAAKKPPAKPGSDDQGGAGDGDEFDPDAEITPEQQAEIDAALEAVEV